MTGLVNPRELPHHSRRAQDRALARSLEEIQSLHRMCREGHLYDVERGITEGKPLQLAPEAIPKGGRPQTALQIALKTGQHSLALLLLSNGYRLDLERYSPLDLALEGRRWDLFDLLVEWGADLKSADVWSVLNTYNTELYERFWAAGYDLTERHEMGSILGHHTSNRALFGFAKRHRTEDPKIQTELNIALCRHVKEGNERGIALCLWAGADPHAPAPSLELMGLRISSDPEGEEGEEERFIGWSAIEEAAREGHLEILKRLGPDPQRDDFDDLYRYARSEPIVEFLVTLQPPGDLTSILGWHLRWMVDRFSNRSGSRYMVERLLCCGKRWEETDPSKLAYLRSSLLKADEYALKGIVGLLKNPEICAPDTYLELIHTPKMVKRLVELKLLKPRVSERKKRREEVARPTSADGCDDGPTSLPFHPVVHREPICYDRATLYEQVWSQPVQHVAKSYGVSGVALAKACRRLIVPVPPRGYWARIRNGYKEKKPPLPKLDNPSSP